MRQHGLAKSARRVLKAQYRLESSVLTPQVLNFLIGDSITKAKIWINIKTEYGLFRTIKFDTATQYAEILK